MKKVYLAGQPDMYEPWREKFYKLAGFEFYNPDVDSDQSSPDTFFPDDLTAVTNADYLVAYPSTSPSEGTWIEIGYFLSKNTKIPGEKCPNLIIIWPQERLPKWSIEFVKKCGTVVSTIQEAVDFLSKNESFAFQDLAIQNSEREIIFVNYQSQADDIKEIAGQY